MMSEGAASQDMRGSGWPNAESSRCVHTQSLTWHLQTFGAGPAFLLLHGTGSATYTWRDIAPHLANHFTVIAPDLPGHGFSSTPPFDAFSMNAMARALFELLQRLDVQPVIAAGHSAGAAILIRMALERYICPRLLISINGALLPQANIPGWLYTPLAKALARRGWVSRFLARTANTRSIERLVADTGSRLDEKGIALYRQLAQRPTHVAAALSMMANWDLVAFAAELPSLEVPLVLLTASGDRTVLPKQATRAQALLPQARLISFGELGHLGHEEQPAEVAQLMLRLAAEAGVLPFRS